MIPENIVFSPEITGLQCQFFTITNDTILESDEMFVVALSTMDQDVILNPSTTSVTILDDDGNVKISPLESIVQLRRVFCGSIHL